MSEELLDLVAGRQFGTLATIRRDGRPQLSTVVYGWYPEEKLIRISSTADRAKVRNLLRDPRAVLHVAAPDGMAYAVVEGDVDVSPVSTEPGDATGREMTELASRFEDPYADLDRFYQRMVDEQRVVIRLPVSRVYGLPPGALPVPD
ncbi:PPOX class F420-dependent oxidoreductase [Amycolatopsis tucumanensis]|uniref:PPOX class F420-dependent oxidoreductase n=1 Tax=Amycolatopsis tucumanensis TaxID=401106 RepID=A0ABP7JL69_9PSEU|nr:PPOX class F420-dependent oxidoreductase [Amycolatopsis tucumanensis]MCF6426751.1 PPOX class F420-dependent oxidoreductase [Amycolatopsis tucumanensis]